MAFLFSPAAGASWKSCDGRRPALLLQHFPFSSSTDCLLFEKSQRFLQLFFHAATESWRPVMHGPELNGPDGRFLFHGVGKHFYIAFSGFALAKPKNISKHIEKRRGFYEKRSWPAGRNQDPGTLETLLVSGRRRHRWLYFLWWDRKNLQPAVDWLQ